MDDVDARGHASLNETGDCYSEATGVWCQRNSAVGTRILNIDCCVQDCHTGE